MTQKILSHFVAPDGLLFFLLVSFFRLADFSSAIAFFSGVSVAIRAFTHYAAAAAFFAAAVSQELRCFTAKPATQTRSMRRDHKPVFLDHSNRMDNTVVIATLLCALRRQRKKRKTRTVWIDPFLSSRKSNGKFYCDYESLRRNPKKFRNCFRMSIDTFDQILERVHNGLQRKDTNMRECISPPEMLMVTLT